MIQHLRELFQYRDLLFSLAQRDIKVRYRQTALGVVWAVAQPLLYMLIFNLVFARFGKVPSDGTPYPLFSYTGLVPWTFFTAGLGLAASSITVNATLVKKIYFPREVFPMGTTIGCFVDFLIASSLVVVLMAIYRVPPSLHLLWLPWLVALEVAFLLAVALFTSAVNAFYRDVKYIVPLLTQLGLFVTPVIYPLSAVPAHLRGLYLLNPMAVVIDGIRTVVLQHRAPDVYPLAVCSLVVGGMAYLSYRFFKRVEVQFADVV